MVCDTVGRAVASNHIEPVFKCIPGQFFAVAMKIKKKSPFKVYIKVSIFLALARLEVWTCGVKEIILLTIVPPLMPTRYLDLDPQVDAMMEL